MPTTWTFSQISSRPSRHSRQVPSAITGGQPVTDGDGGDSRHHALDDPDVFGDEDVRRPQLSPREGALTCLHVEQPA